MRYQFIYNAKESRFSGEECYYVYDTKDKNYIFDVANDITCFHINRQRQILYIYGMEVEEHWILKDFYYGIIQQFLDLSGAFNCVGYHIEECCTGGQIYYEHLNK